MKTLTARLLVALAVLSAAPAAVHAQAAATTIDARASFAPGKGGRDDLRLVGTITFEVRDRAGELKEYRRIRNLVTDAGKAGIASRINGNGGEAAFGHIAIGTGTTAAAAGDTTLQTEISTNGGQRAACTATRVTTDVTNDTAQCVVTFSFTGSFAVTESGYLNAASSGVLLARQVFSAINVVNGDSLQVTWKIDVD